MEFVGLDEDGDAEGPSRGTNRPRIRAIQAAKKETDAVWTWSSAKLPIIMERRIMGSSNSPMLAAVARRAERFISKFPLRFRTTGMIIINWSTSCMARQCYTVGVRIEAVGGDVVLPTLCLVTFQ